MQFVKTVLIVTLTFLWAAASNHCKLEHIPGFEFLVCADHASDGQPSDNGCETDGCSFETQLYKSEGSQASVLAPLRLLQSFLVREGAAILDRQTATLTLPAVAPTDLPDNWQFSHRAALPPRAPSLFS
ncbi:MAG: hypothetical protein EXS31_16445 [Pedosphaera sp.]|nr:hypothetical protein [Pedosphaera sp.]